MIPTDFLIENFEKNNFQELFNRYPIPAVRGSKDLFTFYNETTQNILSDIKSVRVTDEVNPFIHLATEYFQELSDSIGQVIKYLISGKTILAYDLLVSKIDDYFKENYLTIIQPSGMHFYRMIKRFFPYDEIDKNLTATLHVPFDMLNKITEKRFSSAGIPFLYLGTTSYVCWLELDKIKKEDAVISKYIPKSEINLIGLEEINPRIYFNIPNLKMSVYQLVRMIVLFPLSIALLTKAENRKLSVVPEYQFPNLFMQLVNDKPELDGIIFSSTKTDLTTNIHKLCKNVAIKCKRGQDRFSKETLSKFTISKPYIWSSLVFPYERNIFDIKEYWHENISIDDVHCCYWGSEFHFLESELQYMINEGKVIDINII